MRQVLLVCFLSLAVSSVAQPGFKTIVPAHPIAVGESFQVQYIFPGSSKIANFKAPAFRSFRFVSGPDQYTGAFKNANLFFTLEASTPGKFRIPGATVTINGIPVRSNDTYVEVISQQQAGKLSEKNSFNNPDYILRPGEDPYEKIKQNLFLKVMVDRSSCFTGEPVLATFKLYSRLQSKSDIVKNPGFYGFTVYDMVNLTDKKMRTEEINGRLFDVHTIRKVQLFPLQEGLFSIDAMEVVNKVEFSGSVVNKKTEQEIVEGVLGSDEETETGDGSKEVYETRISTQPVLIRVRPLPGLNKPVDFNGAVGHFSISSSLIKNKIAKNEEGVLEIIIAGQGNFTQLNAPVINWPPGIEGFEPVVKDSIDKTQLPLKGNRKFRYAFTCTQPGHYQLPVISFTYFDPGNNYKTISSVPVSLEVSNEEKNYSVKEEKKISITETNASASRTAVIIIVSLVVLVMIYWLRYKKEPEPVKEDRPALPTVGELLSPASVMTGSDDREFYGTLRQCIWNFFITHFQLSGSDMNKEILTSKMRSAGVAKEETDRIDMILQNCEAGMFTKAEMAADKKGLLLHTEEVLERISSYLFKTA